MLILTQGRGAHSFIHAGGRGLDRSEIIGSPRSREENERALKGPNPLKDMTFPSS